MSFKISDEKIAEIKEATDIVELISGYLTLKKRGKNFFGLCPFHQENSPSFSVDPARKMYYCYGCHKGGDSISFLMNYDRMSFVEAIQLLAEKAGISLPRVQADDSRIKEKESLYFANKFAAEFFYNNLINPIGKKALSYLYNRGFDDSIIRGFGMGYSLPQWDGLIKHARRKSVSIEILYKAGLIIKKDGGGYYDRFRGRMMTPIINLSKKVVGFGGRILTEDKKSPKYINSPETPVYQKSQILFGLNRTREHIREKDQAIFVEGYTDLISLFKHEIKNTVATSGTALTIQQAQLIKRYTGNIILLYDSDAAGLAAAMRGADIFLNAGLEVRVAVLPQGHDPDSFIRASGKDAFLQILSQSVSLIKFKIETLSKQYNMTLNQDRTKVIQLALESIAKIRNSIRQDLALKDVAEYFAIDEMALRNQLKTAKKTEYTEVEKTAVTDKVKKTAMTKYDIAEENIVRIMIEDNELIPDVYDNINVDEIKNSSIKEIVKIIFNHYKQNKKINAQNIINSIVDPQMNATLSELLSVQFSEELDLIKLLNDCIISIKERALEQQLQTILHEIKTIQSQGGEAKELMKKYQKWRMNLAQLKSKKIVTTQKNA